jgi:hypothetical protein
MDQSDSVSDSIIFCVCLANRQQIYFTKLPFFYFPALGYGRKENNLEENNMHVSVTVLFSSAVMTEYSITSNEQVRLTTSTSLQ